MTVRFLLCCVLVACLMPPALASMAQCMKEDPPAKALVCAMDQAITVLYPDGWKNYTKWYNVMKPFWSEDFSYIPFTGFPTTKGLWNWWNGEYTLWNKAFPEHAFNQLLFLGDTIQASTTTYALGVWQDNLGPLSPSKGFTKVRICDFYLLERGAKKIKVNWMMIDTLDMLRQSGIAPLPLSPLPQGIVYLPRVMEGVPAPVSFFVDPTRTENARQVVNAMLNAEWSAQSPQATYWHPDMVWYGPVPFGMATGIEEYRRYFLEPLHMAFSKPNVTLDVFVCQDVFCAVRGTFSALHTGEWLGYPASNRRLSLDFGMHFRVRHTRIAEGWAMFDLPKMFLQLGVDLHNETRYLHVGSHRFRNAPAAKEDPDDDAF